MTPIGKKDKYFPFHPDDMHGIPQFKVKPDSSYELILLATVWICYLLLMTLVKKMLFDTSQVYAHVLKQPK